MSRDDFYIAVDFDGTIVDHAYPDIGVPAPGAIFWMNRFHELGAKLVLFTMRSGVHLDAAVKFLKDNEVTLHGINHNPDQASWTDSPKAYAHVYIDDAAFGCPLIDESKYNRPIVNWAHVGPALECKLLVRAKLNKGGSW